jgi:hypothetical protein
MCPAIVCCVPLGAAVSCRVLSCPAVVRHLLRRDGRRPSELAEPGGVLGWVY